MPLVLFGVHGDRTILATAIQQIRPADFFAKKWQDLVESESEVPRWIGVVPYDEFCPNAERKQPSLIYEIHEALIWQKGALSPERMVCGDPTKCALRLTTTQLKDIERDILKHTQKNTSNSPFSSTPGSRLHSTMSDETYLSQVQNVLDEIRKGTFYQLNLLRYFRFDRSWKWPQVCARLNEHGGPMSSVFRHGNTAIASFSPERFVSITREGAIPTIHTWPIKGTVRRDSGNAYQDHQAQELLLKSEKDLAELHMIVDLMRNDLQRVCLPKTVEVPIPHRVRSFAHVHHLESHVCGNLNSEITMFDLFSALAPGGSITGAPKIEVMKHIRQMEGRERGFMMGNAFVVNADGTMDSSILIRTMTSSDGARTWEYAAGSGLVIKSDPQTELQEIFTKCRPITD